MSVLVAAARPRERKLRFGAAGASGCSAAAAAVSNGSAVVVALSARGTSSSFGQSMLSFARRVHGVSVSIGSVTFGAAPDTSRVHGVSVSIGSVTFGAAPDTSRVHGMSVSSGSATLSIV